MTLSFARTCPTGDDVQSEGPDLVRRSRIDRTRRAAFVEPHADLAHELSAARDTAANLVTGARMRRLLPYVAVTVAGIVAVFALPWFVPTPSTPSVSYAVGFNNRVSILGVLAMATVLGVLATRRRGATDSSPRPLFLTRVSPAERIPRTALVAVLGCSALAMAVISRLTYGDFGYAEMSYALDRMAYALAGFAPYRTFEFAYGPLMLYLPVWVHRLTGLGPQAAYIIAFAAWHLAGLVLAYYVANRLGIDRRAKTVLFLALGLYLLVNESMGMSYSYTRSLMPFAALLFVYSTHGRTAASKRADLAPLVLWAAAAAAILLNTAISPEMGIAAAFGLLVYLGYTAWRLKGRYLWALVGYVGSLAGLFALAQGAMGTLSGFAAGGGDLPILPGPPLLVYLLGVVVVAVSLPMLLRRGAQESAVVLGAVAIALALTPAVLSRADSGHVIMNSLVIVFLAALALGRRSPRACLQYVTLVAVVFAAAHVLQFSYQYAPRLRVEVGRGVLGAPRPDRLKASDVSRLAGFQPIAAPFGFMDDTGFQLADRGWLATNFYLHPAMSADELRREEASIGGARGILVQSRAQLDPAKVGQAFPTRLDMLGLAMFPITLQLRPQPQPYAQAFAVYLGAHYREKGPIGHYILYERLSDPGPAPGPPVAESVTRTFGRPR